MGITRTRLSPSVLVLCWCTLAGISMTAGARTTAPNEWTNLRAPGVTTIVSQGNSIYAVPGVYGILGTPDAANTPGGRDSAATWTDSSGNFWLFGGGGYDANGNYGTLNDLWEFQPSTQIWTWIGGSSTLPSECAGALNTPCGQPGVYGPSTLPVLQTSPAVAVPQRPGSITAATSGSSAAMALMRWRKEES